MLTAEGKKISEALDWIIHIAIAIVIGVLIVVFVGQRTIVHDISMEPTLVEGDNLIVEKLGFRFGWLKRGDIIVFKSPQEDRQLIKRLIAVEGDKVEIKDGKVYVNGELSLTGLPDEPPTPGGEYSDLTVEKGQVYVLGDNRQFSQDSTEFGPIDADWITGRAIFRFYPFDKFGGI
ncbi:MAG: signal peptidase I [Clostridiaceae bacterium]